MKNTSILNPFIFFLLYTLVLIPTFSTELDLYPFTPFYESLQPKLVPHSSGGFLLLIDSINLDGDLIGVFGRLYDSNFLPKTGFIQINTYNTGIQEHAEACEQPTTGHFIITWRSEAQQAGNNAIYARFMDIDGNFITAETEISSNTGFDASAPRVSCLSSGEFIITFTRLTSPEEIYGWRYKPNPNFTVSVAETKVAVSSAGNQNRGMMIPLDSGNSILIFLENNRDGQQNGIFMQVKDEDFVAVSAIVQANSFSFGSQEYQSFTKLTPSNSGDFAIAFTDSIVNIRVKTFDNALNVVDSELLVTVDNTQLKLNTDIICTDTGYIVVVWSAQSLDTDGLGIFGTILTPSFTIFSAEFQINEYVVGQQINPRIMVLPNEEFLVVWKDYNLQSTFGKRFKIADPPIELCFGTKQDGECVENYCLIDSDCQGVGRNSTTPFCQDYICDGCQTDEDCYDHNSPFNNDLYFCDIGTHQCQACLDGASLIIPEEICPTCDEACAVCNGPHHTTCLECNDGYYEADEGSCLPCDSACDTCDGPGEENCIYQCAEQGEAVFYADESCILLEECEIPPFQILNNGTHDICSHPCENNQHYLLNDTTQQQQCVDSCPQDKIYSINEYVQGCALAKTEEPEGTEEEDALNYDDIKFQAQIVATVDSGAKLLAGVTMVQASRGPSVMALIILNKFLFYLAFISVKYPANLLVYFKQYEDSAFELEIPVPDSVSDSINQGDIPSNFDAYGLHSSFLVNFWEPGSIIVITFLAAIFISLINSLVQKQKRSFAFAAFIYQIKMIIRWNFMILVLCSTFDEIILFSALEFQFSNSGTPTRIGGIVAAVIFLALMIVLVFKTIHIVRKYQKQKNQIYPEASSPTKKTIYEQFEYYKVLFVGYKSKSFMSQGYMVFFLLRLILFGLVIALLFDHPLIQIISILALTVLMLLYNLLKRPLKKNLDLIEIVLYELVILVANCCCLRMILLDKDNNEDQNLRGTLADVIIGCFFAFSAIAVLFLVINLILGIKEFIHQIRQSKRMGTLSCIQILAIPFQSGGMDFGDLDANKIQSKASSPVKVQQQQQQKNNQARRDSQPVQTLQTTNTQTEIMITELEGLNHGDEYSQRKQSLGDLPFTPHSRMMSPHVSNPGSLTFTNALKRNMFKPTTRESDRVRLNSSRSNESEAKPAKRMSEEFHFKKKGEVGLSNFNRKAFQKKK